MEGTRLKVVTASDPNYMRTLEAAVRVGEPMLLKVTFFTIIITLQPLYNTIVGVHDNFRVSYPICVITRIKYIDI